MFLLMSLPDRKVNTNNYIQFLDLVKAYDTSKLINGFEIASKNLSYIQQMAAASDKEGYHFRLHYDGLYGDDLIPFIDAADEISWEVGYPIHVVFHDFNQTAIDYIIAGHKNVTYSLENLNILKGARRINTDRIDQFLMTPGIAYTYDIGHEIYDGINPGLSAVKKQKIDEIHAHSVVNNIDHYYITPDSLDASEVKRRMVPGIPCVLEYAIDYMPGDTLEDKEIFYIKSFATFEALMQSV
jgi:hypothetical protein